VKVRWNPLTSQISQVQFFSGRRIPESPGSLLLCPDRRDHPFDPSESFGLTPRAEILLSYECSVAGVASGLRLGVVRIASNAVAAARVASGTRTP
jgi:hypothetical protein